MFAYFVFSLMGMALTGLLMIAIGRSECRCRPAAAPTRDPAELTRVKHETAALLASPRSILHKGALVSRTARSLDISIEKEAISRFVASPTGLACPAWIDERGSAAPADGGAGPWSTFFPTLAEIATMTNPCLAGIEAAEIELLFDDLTDDDIRRICCLGSGIFDTLAGVSRNRTGSPTVSVFADVARVLRDDGAQLQAELLQLKNAGVVDPNVDFFLAAIEGDGNRAMAALEVGADLEAGHADF